MADSFSGAEAAVDTQAKSALDALAQFGRRGLEAAVIAQTEGNRIQSATDATVSRSAYDAKVSGPAKAALLAINDPGQAAYALNGAQTVAFMGSENDAAQQVNKNFYGQLRQSVPLARTEAAQIADEYRAAHAERQAQIAADAESRRMMMANAAMEQQMMREEQMRQQAIFDIQYGDYIAAQQARQAEAANYARWAATAAPINTRLRAKGLL